MKLPSSMKTLEVRLSYESLWWVFLWMHKKPLSRRSLRAVVITVDSKAAIKLSILISWEQYLNYSNPLRTQFLVPFLFLVSSWFLLPFHSLVPVQFIKQYHVLLIDCYRYKRPARFATTTDSGISSAADAHPWQEWLPTASKAHLRWTGNWQCYYSCKESRTNAFLFLR